MNDILKETLKEDEIETAAEVADIPTTGLEADPEKPAGLPDKFWDAENREVRVDALWQSYRELEKRFGKGERHVPDTPEDYCLDCGDREPDPEVNAELHKAGFSNDQAQVVYDLAAKYVLPALEEANSNLATENVRGRLEEHFGGKERWSRIARQLNDWGTAHLPTDVMDALSGSFDGVIALHRMMKSEEPGVGQAEAASETLDEAALRKLMGDPRYWRDRDPALIDKVRTGFQRLYPG